MSRHLVLALAVVGVLGLGAAARAGSYTDISATSTDSDGNLISALNNAYGSVWGNITTADTNAITFTTNGSVSGNYLVFQRILDGGGTSPLNIHGNGVGAEDQTFQDGSGAFTFEIKWAGNSEAFGWYEGGTTHKIFDTTTGDAPGSQTTKNLSTNFGFYLTSPVGSSFTWYSEISKNADGQDHLVTYRMYQYNSNGQLITGQQAEWLLAFEDLSIVYNQNNVCTSSDRDYQDVIVSLKAVPVPLPAAVLPGLAMLGGLGLFRAMRRKARA